MSRTTELAEMLMFPPFPSPYVLAEIAESLSSVNEPALMSMSPPFPAGN